MIIKVRDVFVFIQKTTLVLSNLRFFITHRLAAQISTKRIYYENLLGPFDTSMLYHMVTKNDDKNKMYQWFLGKCSCPYTRNETLVSLFTLLKTNQCIMH